MLHVVAKIMNCEILATRFKSSQVVNWDPFFGAKHLLVVCYASLINLVSSQLCPFSNSNCFGQSQTARTRVKHDSNLWVFEGRGWGDWLDAGKSPTWSNAESAPLEPSSPSSPPTTLTPQPAQPRTSRLPGGSMQKSIQKKNKRVSKSQFEREKKNGGLKTQRICDSCMRVTHTHTLCEWLRDIAS